MKHKRTATTLNSTMIHGQEFSNFFGTQLVLLVPQPISTVSTPPSTGFVSLAALTTLSAAARSGRSFGHLCKVVTPRCLNMKRIFLCELALHQLATVFELGPTIFAPPETIVILPDQPIVVAGVGPGSSVIAELSSPQPLFKNWASILKNQQDVGFSTTVSNGDQVQLQIQAAINPGGVQREVTLTIGANKDSGKEKN